MKHGYRKIAALFIIFSFILTSGFGCKLQDAKTKEAMKPVTLVYWRAWDEQDSFDGIIKKYNAIHPNIKIEYRKFRYDEYEKELLNALAEDRGPDIFSIPSTWVKKYQSKIYPMPESTTLAYPEVQGTLKKETIIKLKTNKTISLKEMKNNFVDTVYNDVVMKIPNEKTKQIDEKVFGLPLFVDTMAMFYNKDLLNNAGIAEQPTYWNKTFQQNVKKLTKQNVKGQIIQSGVAMGGSANIERSIDLLSALMMQNGATMMDDSGKVLFDSVPPGRQDQQYIPGLEALRFYTDFANPAKEVYSWNKELDNSLKMFIDNKLAIMFGYSYHLPIIKAEAPKLNFAVAKLPQIENSAKEINFANYWVETVSKKSKNINEAWDFVQFMSKADEVKTYLSKTNRPPALRSLINKADFYENGSDANSFYMDVFVSQVLTSKTWYHGKDEESANKIMEEMVDSVNAGQNDIAEIISLGARKVQQTVE